MKCSAKWVVRDLTRAEPSVSCDTKEQAEAWVRHLWEWRPNARPVIERETAETGHGCTPSYKVTADHPIKARPDKGGMNWNEASNILIALDSAASPCLVCAWP